MKAKPWNEHKETIIRLYRQKALKDVHFIMRTKHSFDASRNEKRRISPAARVPVSGSRSPPKVPVKKEVIESSSYYQPLAGMCQTGYPDYKWLQWTRPDEAILHNLYAPTQAMFPSVTALRQENDSTTGARHIQPLSDTYFTQLCDPNAPFYMYPFYGTAV
ncbi:hypothetical protein FANTH_13688 [Fusarium anthophilum]|uniref:Clr5 domain-containing protein n=1 Tax=Fusarium anthophilum TaxID=48485 RepID=A0A8H5DPJ0_9HYPO|nr:hypothetical protein FANTH_13688 [Fusarium anthophilum]